MATITTDRIDAVRRHVADAVTQTSPGSTLPEPEQNRLLEQALAESCELIGDWLDSRQSLALPAAPDVPLRELLKDHEQLSQFLSPLFADALERAKAASDDRAATVAQAREEVSRAVREARANARRHPRMTTGQLRQVATDNVQKLRNEVCQLAQGYATRRRESLAQQSASAAEEEARGRSWRRKAVKALKVVGGFMLPLTVSLLLSVSGPHQAGQNVSAWTQAAHVVVTHDLAVHAQPGVSIGPRPSGPALH
jgi:vacuolar-type H+-ATPase subunit H